MTKKSTTVVFFGSGPVAASSLEFLAKKFTIEAVVTKPRPPHHKGDVPVIDVAKRFDLPLVTVRTKDELHTAVKKAHFRSNVGILVDFAIIVLPETIALFDKGIINSHFSLLPKLRGPDPITYAILEGHKYSGTSIMLLAPGVDEGPLLAQSPFELPASITTPELTDALVVISNETLVKVVPDYLSGKVHPAPQEKVTIADSTKTTYSHRISKSDGVIDWTGKSAQQIEREIRAFCDWPGSRTTLFGKDVIITKARAVSADGKPGEVTIIKEPKKHFEPVLAVFAKNGYISIERLKPAGRKEMSVKDFISGYAK